MKLLRRSFGGGLLCLLFFAFSAQAGNRHDEHGPHEMGHEEENSLHLDRAQLEAAGIEVHPLEAAPLPEEIEAPGEVLLNRYATSQVTPRIEAQVVARHARLGDQVKQNQPLVTLSSAEMSEAQGELIIAARDWQRMKSLETELVSEQTRLESQVRFQQAWARLLAYGMQPEQIQKLVNTGDVRRADGNFTLLAPQAGTLIRDPFVTGEMVEPGTLLFEITDESSIWVEAHVPPERMTQIKVGAAARIRAGDRWIQGRVVQVHHALDETTRTMGVRLEIPNAGDHLHPGQFVTARIRVGQGEPVPSLPLEAVLRSPDGDWQVFVEHEPGEFEPKEVTLVRRVADLAVIEGVQPGTPVVTRGAFFLQSELAKSGFEVHNH